jgi:hypothetical protein
MDTFLQGIGLVACLGVILIAALGFFIFRRATGSRTTPNRQRDSMRTPTASTHGGERPRHDSSRVESSGGFGSAPGSTRGTADRTARRGAASYEDRRGAPSSEPRSRRSSRDRRDDRPTGGFGSG